jgi:hypothetical protein
MNEIENKHQVRFYGNCVDDFEQDLSPKLRALAQDFAREMSEEYEQRKRWVYGLLKRHADDAGLKEYWTPEQIEKYANGDDEPLALTRLREKPFDKIEWHDINEAASQDREQTAAAMTVMYESVADHLAAGIYAADAIDCKKPIERAQFILIRNAFNDEWKPRGGVEASLVDMLAQTYVAWQYWLGRSFSIANHEDDVAEQVKQNKQYDGTTRWQPPRLTASEYLERATQMAYRFQGMYMRTLRQMRDLRRYAIPMTINNPQQVNIAAEGGQQVNVQQQKKGRRRRKAPGSGKQSKRATKPKQLNAEKERGRC